MPLRTQWQLQREGITADTIGRLISRTILNPYLTLPWLLLSRYTQRGREKAIAHPTFLRRLRLAFILGLLQRITAFLNRRVLNNSTTDEKYDWSKEVVVITGGSDGIGAAIVRLLAERGIKVAVLDIQPLQYKAPSCVRYYTCDITSHTAIQASAAAITNDFGGLAPTILINNAGRAHGKPILDTTPTDLHSTFSINTLSHYPLIQTFLPNMIARDHGMIVTVASIAAYITAPRMVDYSASKAAAVSFHEGLAAELPTLYNAPKVRTVLVTQGYTRTAMFDGFDPGDGFLSYALAPGTVAEAVVRAVLAGQSAHVVLPAVHDYFALLVRAWPLWLQAALRKDLVKLMRRYKGRQILQPSGVASLAGDVASTYTPTAAAAVAAAPAITEHEKQA